LHLPDESPVEIIDPFSQLHLGTDTAEVPIPKNAFRDEASLKAWPSTDLVAHLFAKDPSYVEREAIAGDIGRWIDNLDRFRIARAQVPLTCDTPYEMFDRLADIQDRVFVTVRADPHEGMIAVRRITDLATRYPFIRSISITPHMLYPPIPPNSKEYYPIYAKCVELDLAVFVNVGFPGPRVPASSQDPMHLDEVCWFFPDLRIVMRHGGEPWSDVCVKLLEKWPNLYYATTAFAPKYYPKNIIDFVNRRGVDKVLYAGYWPILSYERIFDELSQLPLRDKVWPKFLSENARRAFAL
jgi:predicted TIM-barrel fold metal-dependent hydrolase